MNSAHPNSSAPAPFEGVDTHEEPLQTRPTIHVVGIDGSGCAGLTSSAVQVAAAAQVLVGGDRQLATFPQHSGKQVRLKGPLDSKLEEIAHLAEENDICVLASGDPLFFGIAQRIIKRLGASRVRVLPTVSSMQLAFALAQIPWNEAALISVHGRGLNGLSSKLRSSRRAGIFTDPRNTPVRIAEHLLEYNDSNWRAVVCEQIGTPEERTRKFASMEDLSRCKDLNSLNVLILERRDAEFRPAATLSYKTEAEFAKKVPKAGLITKREIRALLLAQLDLRPDSIVWDVGAGSGSVAIEAASLAHHGHIFAVESDPTCIEYCERNVRDHGADNVTVVSGSAPEALKELPRPNSVFIGGSRGSMAEILAAVAQRMLPGGRLVVSAVTMESIAEARESLLDLDMDVQVTLIQCSRGVPLARYMRYEALNPIHLFSASVGKPASLSEGPR